MASAVNTILKTPDRYAVIGYPVSHSFSPFIHGMFAKQTGQNLTYRLLEVAPEAFEHEVMRFFVDHGKGLNVTIPHKQVAFEFCKQRTARAERARAINTIAVQANGSLLGDNTDGAGLIADLKRNLEFDLRDKRILLLGAGGAARGVLGPLLEEKPKCIHILNRSAEKAQALAKEFETMGELVGDGFDATDGEAYDLIVNATAASLQNAMPSISASTVARKTVCYDLAYGKEDTPFTHWAKQQGTARAQLGWGMLIEQAAESFYLWRGVRPDTAPVLKAVTSPPPQRAAS